VFGLFHEAKIKVNNVVIAVMKMKSIVLHIKNVKVPLKQKRKRINLLKNRRNLIIYDLERVDYVQILYLKMDIVINATFSDISKVMFVVSVENVQCITETVVNIVINIDPLIYVLVFKYQHNVLSRPSNKINQNL